jgi:hypothetical protein
VVADNQLTLVAEQLAAAHKPEEIFGPLADANRNYKRLARVAHPDRYTDGARSLAEDAMRKLNVLWDLAEKAISNGTYGTARSVSVNAFRVRSRKHSFEIAGAWRSDEISRYYHATCDDADAVVRITRKPRDNDLTANEATVLKTLAKEVPADYAAYFPTLLDSFQFKSKRMTRRANAFVLPEGLWTLDAVQRAYPYGIDPRDMAWIFRRLLVALGAAHEQGIVHGAVLPRNVLIQPEKHGLVLVNWAYASDGQPLKAYDPAYKTFYPEEALAREPLTYETDVFMAARAMRAVLSGTGASVPWGVPAPIRNFLRACTLPKASRRPDDAWVLKDSWDELLERMWGPRRFHKFSIPTTAKEGE